MMKARMNADKTGKPIMQISQKKTEPHTVEGKEKYPDHTHPFTAVRSLGVRYRFDMPLPAI